MYWILGFLFVAGLLTSLGWQMHFIRLLDLEDQRRDRLAAELRLALGQPDIGNGVGRKHLRNALRIALGGN